MKAVKSQKGRTKVAPFVFANNSTTGESCLLHQRYEHIPIDYIQAVVIGISPESFLNRFEFIPVLKECGEVHYYYLISENIKIVIYPISGRTLFKGSLHKFYNRGLHNHNDFDLNAFNSVLRRLECEFGIRPENLRLEQMEYGLNIIPPIATDTILNHLLEHGCREFERVLNSSRGSYSQIERTEYILKIYNKAKQYKQPNQILRFEIKAKTGKFKSIAPNVHTLFDFIRSDKRAFILSLINEWERVTLFDPTINTQFLKPHQIKYRDVENWRGWFKRSDTTVNRHRNKVRLLNAQIGENVQMQIRDLFFQKINSLQGVRNSDFTQINRVCKLTGIDISMQREDSFLLSHKGLKHLKETNISEFERIKMKYLPVNWRNESEYNQIKEIAHSIRNAFNNRMKRTNPNQVLLSL